METFQVPPERLVFMATIIAWFSAQTTKVIIGVLREKRFNFKWFLGTGGMPSAHTAAVSAITLAMGATYGVSSPIFTLTLVFAIIVISDAQGVRHSTGKQAEILNKLLDDIYWKKKIQEDRLKEFLGHTPVQVFAGMFVGIVVSLLFYWKYIF